MLNYLLVLRFFLIIIKCAYLCMPNDSENLWKIFFFELRKKRFFSKHQFKINV